MRRVKQWGIRKLILLAALLVMFNSVSFADLFSPPTKTYWYQEQFNSKISTLWQKVSDQGDISVTDDGMLRFGSYRYHQAVNFSKSIIKTPDDFGMEFVFEVNALGNAGDITRPVLFVAPRGKDSEFKESYQLRYHLENLQMGMIISNQYMCKWEIVNTALPEGSQSLGTGHFIILEDQHYFGRLSVETLKDESVKLEFYLDGPGNPNKEYIPLISVTDNSEKRIVHGNHGVNIGTVGFDDDAWGTNPTVKFDQVRFYSGEAFRKRTADLLEYSKTWISEKLLGERYGKVRYLINQRMLLTTLTGDLELERQTTVDDMLFSLFAIDSGNYEAVLNKYGSQKTLPVTKKLASDMIHVYLNRPQPLSAYLDIPKDLSATDIAQHYAYQKGLLTLDENLKFNDTYILNRSESIDLILRLVNPADRIPNRPVSVPDIFTSSGVFQRDKPIKVWGNGMSGDQITVDFANKRYFADVKNGKWSLEMPAHEAGGPYNLRISDRGHVLLAEDFHVGEVFIVAGQSNAEMPFEQTENAKMLREKLINKKNIRFFFNEHYLAVTPRESAEGMWYYPDTWGINNSSAIGTYFVDSLVTMNPELENMKIGIIRLTYGGTSIEMFTPPEGVANGYIQQPDLPIMSGFWNGYMDYLAPYPVKAVLYYQGENSTQLRYSYEPLLRNYISGFRTAFKDPSLPFFLVQITGYGDNYYQTDADSWPIIRGIQNRVANTMPHTEIVPTIDLKAAEPLEIHPKLKRPIGERLAHRASAVLYKHSNTLGCPEMSVVMRVDGGYEIKISNVGSGLSKINQDGLIAFEIQGEDKKWCKADFEILSDRETVRVWCDEIENPQGVRYAWRNYPGNPIVNSHGLPLMPFNTKFNLKHSNRESLETETFQLKMSHHMLQTFDAVENVTRGNTFRTIKRVDDALVYLPFYIHGQQTGDTIKLFQFQGRKNAEPGTGKDILVLKNHGLEVGDWIRNNSCSWKVSKVTEVVDSNTVRIQPIETQKSGDEIEVYHYLRTTKAE